MDRAERKRKLLRFREVLGDISQPTAYAILNGRHGLSPRRAQMAVWHLGGDIMLWCERGNKAAKRWWYKEAKI